LVQHCPFQLQAWPISVHPFPGQQMPPTPHFCEQQSMLAPHGAQSDVQPPPLTQTKLVQLPEQQSAPLPQIEASSPQGGPHTPLLHP
jgi:hypothetical protein